MWSSPQKDDPQESVDVKTENEHRASETEVVGATLQGLRQPSLHAERDKALSKKRETASSTFSPKKKSERHNPGPLRTSQASMKQGGNRQSGA